MKNLKITILLLVSLGSFYSSPQNQINSNSTVTRYILENEIFQTWDIASSKMVNDWKIEYIFNDGGLMTEYITENWVDGEWKNESKTELTYDTNGYLIQTLSYNWNNTQQWISNQKIEYIYDINGNLSQRYIFYDWNETYWKHKSKIEHLYDTNERLIKDLCFDWFQGQWSIGGEVDYTYNNEKLIQKVILISYWDDYKYDYSYDTIGNLVQTTSYTANDGNPYNPVPLNWGVLGKTEYTYDDYWNPLEHIVYSWSEGIWVNSKKVEYTYNNSFLLSDLILPLFYNNAEYNIFNINQGLTESCWFGLDINLADMFFRYMMTNRTEYNWNEDSISWTLAKTSDYAYSESEILSIQNIDLEQLKIYPNPVSTELNIQLNNGLKLHKVQLYNVLGQLVKNSHRPQINVSNLNQGLYFVTIETDRGIASRKIIIK